ncbi:RNA polymerase sigma factor SigJ [Promicromonospora sp. NPDC019610]|uniref:RNA polymerase sigma factor SigJ n=1 Tax=Promicromonospora sp. NPDC019610 TaxID=3364405 RepID=UPI00379E37D3
MTDQPVGDGQPAQEEVLLGERRQLLNLAYRLLGSLSDAEDVVQEAYARWYAMSRPDREAVVSPGAWLTTVAGRICLNVLSSARVRRETYVGEWVPEPVPEPTEWLGGRANGAPGDPADRITLDESVSMAFLVVLDAMTPAERVAFVLHDVFRYSFPEVAEIVGRTPGACRQLASSARRRIRAARAPVTPTTDQARIVRAFRLAWEAQDIEAVVGLLAPDVRATSDGGGRVRTVLRPVVGVGRILRSFAALADRFRGQTLLERTVNGQPGLVAQRDGVTVSVYAFEVVDDRITHIWAIRNPDKLRSWTAGGAVAGPG